MREAAFFVGLQIIINIKEMKKILFVCVACLIVLTACQPSAESYIKDMKNLVEDVIEDGGDYTAEQWEAANQKFEELVEKAQEMEGLTDEQKKEIRKLKGKFSGAAVKKGFDKFMKDAGRELEKAGEAIEGFLEGLKDN